MPEAKAIEFKFDSVATGELLGLSAGSIHIPTALVESDLCGDGAYDVVLTTNSEVLGHVRRMGRTTGAFGLAEFLISAYSAEDSEFYSAVRAITALPQPLRDALAKGSLEVSLAHMVELPKSSMSEPNVLAVAIACSLGFAVRLKHTVKEHAERLLMCELQTLYPTVESLRATRQIDEDLAERFSTSDSGGMCARERLVTIQAYIAELVRRSEAKADSEN